MDDRLLYTLERRWKPNANPRNIKQFEVLINDEPPAQNLLSKQFSANINFDSNSQEISLHYIYSKTMQ